MSKTIKFNLSDSNYEILCSRANENALSIQDYIRMLLFPSQISITPQIAVNKALSQYKSGDNFTVPEIFGNEWNLPNGVAGQFGKKFAELVNQQYSTQIKFTGNYNSKNHAVYKML